MAGLPQRRRVPEEGINQPVVDYLRSAPAAGMVIPDVTLRRSTRSWPSPGAPPGPGLVGSASACRRSTILPQGCGAP